MLASFAVVGKLCLTKSCETFLVCVFNQVEELHPAYSKLNYVFLAKVSTGHISTWIVKYKLFYRMLIGQNSRLTVLGLFFGSATKTWASVKRLRRCIKLLVQ